MTWRCPDGLCDGAGLLVDEAQNTAYPCPCQPARRAAVLAARCHARVPERHRNLSFDRAPLSWMDSPALGAARAYARDLVGRMERGEGLWVAGSGGSGKSSLLFAVAGQALQARRSVLTLTGERMLALLRPDDRYMPEVADAVRSCDLLVLDDLIPARLTGWGREQLAQVLDARSEWLRPVLASTSLGAAADVAKHIGPRACSRLLGICGEPVSCETAVAAVS